MDRGKRWREKNNVKIKIVHRKREREKEKHAHLKFLKFGMSFVIEKRDDKGIT